jgi:hypothetical protein
MPYTRTQLAADIEAIAAKARDAGHEREAVALAKIYIELKESMKPPSEGAGVNAFY